MSSDKISDKSPHASPTWGPMRSFGRIKARTLKPRQAGLFDTLLPRIEVNDALLDALSGGPEAVQAGCRELWLEIGFGAGEHLAAQAQLNPQALIIGCEPFLNGVGSALRHIDEVGIENVRILSSDARPMLDRLPEASVSRIYILFPDPWPKARHHKRRLIQPDSLEALARVLKPGGRLRFATDWADYADWTLELILKSGLYDWPAQRPADWTIPPQDHVTTRYETKGLGDCAPVFIDVFRR
jgi:tRNA (guanine-N7-)-methyltransferase